MPEHLELKRGANTRLFVQTPFGALMMNNKAGQQYLEERGVLTERKPPEPIAPPPEAAPKAAPEAPPAAPPVADTTDPEPEPKRQKGFLESFFE